jgi:hypothetical protein
MMYLPISFAGSILAVWLWIDDSIDPVPAALGKSHLDVLHTLHSSLV